MNYKNGMINLEEFNYYNLNNTLKQKKDKYKIIFLENLKDKYKKKKDIIKQNNIPKNKTSEEKSI